MKTPTRSLVLCVMLGVSGGVGAIALETEHSAYELPQYFAMNPGTMEAGQAGRSGPESLPMTRAEREAQARPVETLHNAYDFLSEDAAGRN